MSEILYKRELSAPCTLCGAAGDKPCVSRGGYPRGWHVVRIKGPRVLVTRYKDQVL